MALTKVSFSMIEGDPVDVRAYGAVGDGVADDTAAVQAAAAAVGYAYFSAGNYLINTTTIDAPCVFEWDSNITAPTGQTVTITGYIQSPRQWIFRGAGSYSLGNDADTGENSRQILAAWFGIFPTANTETDQAPQLAKCFSALGNLRESVVEFDIGRYYVGAALSVPRGCRILGQGTRRTVFASLTDGYSLFTTIGVAARFEGIQFELATSFVATHRTSPWIEINTSECEIYDVLLGRANQSIVVKANNCRINNITAVYTIYPGANSSLASVQSNNCLIDNVLLGTSSFGPDAIVEVGAAASANISNSVVKNITWVTPSIGVLVSASTYQVSRVFIQNLAYAGLAGTNAANVIKFATTSTGGIQNCSISGITASSEATNGILFDQNSSSSIDDITIDNVNIDGSTGYGISFVETSGGLSDITVGPTVDVSARATPYSFTGNPDRISISPLALPNALPATVFDFNIANDSFAQVNLYRSVFTGFLMVSSNATNYALYSIRAASTPSVTSVSASANMATALVPLNGTTGTIGQFTTGVTDGVLYFENRLGTSQRVSVALLTGVA